MTMLDRAIGIDGPPHIWFRLTALLFAILLGAQCLWLVLAELARPSINQLPTDMASAAAAAKQRDAAFRAASIGAIRSDLWAEAAFTYADLLWGEKNETIATRTLLRPCCTHVQLSLAPLMMALINPAPGYSSPD